MRRSLVTLVMVAGLSAGAMAAPAQAAYPAPVATGHPRPVTIAAAGDIACAPGVPTTTLSCRQGATAQLVKRVDPASVLVLGDAQYEIGALSAFRQSYDESWGQFKRRTHPAPGNHEYGTAGARGYYRYFRHQQPGPPGWYAYRLGSWRAYALNSECTIVDCDAESRWLRRDLAAHPRSCSLMYTHHPRWSSGLEHGSDSSLTGLWRVAYRHHVDVALAGHEHNYERFARLDATGHQRPRGVMSFVVGTGGRSLYPFGPPEDGSKVRYSADFGVLVMRLGRGSYTWHFRTIGGRVVDHGTRSCV